MRVREAHNDPGRVCGVEGVLRIGQETSTWTAEEVVTEEPLEIRLLHGPEEKRQEKTLSITMRTPGHDIELAAGFLLSEGVIREADDIEAIEPVGLGGRSLHHAVRVTMHPSVQVNHVSLDRNFYTTSGCGICGRASLLALETIAPPRRSNAFTMQPTTIRTLPESLRLRQGLFARTGGLHGAALASSQGELTLCREDIGRHNAVDKLVGAAAMAGNLPLRDNALLLSGRVSFDLMQKAVMAGIPMVIAIGAPSSLAVDMARRFGITLVGFLREDHFNIYSGADHVGVTV